jgi:hypothetical protein
LLGKAAAGVELSARKPARCWYRSIAPDHEELVVPEKLMENPGVFLRCRSAHRKTLVFFVAVLSAKLLRLGFVSCTYFSANGFTIGERKQNT